MIILSWKIRGLGSSGKRWEVRNIVRRFKCDILILCESKLASPSLTLLRNLGGGRLNKWKFLPSSGASDGIIIGWNERLFAYLDTYRCQFSLSLKFKSLSNNFGWWLTRVYGPCSANLKSLFLDELHQLFGPLGNNWVIGGDFNFTRFSHEHSNRFRVSPIMTRFNDFTATANLIDLSPNYCLYTWSNFQENAIMVKLDQFLISPSWESQYPRAICIGKYQVTSDHILICIDTISPGWGPFLLKFYKSWLFLEGFDDLIQNSISTFSTSACLQA